MNCCCPRSKTCRRWGCSGLTLVDIICWKIGRGGSLLLIRILDYWLEIWWMFCVNTLKSWVSLIRTWIVWRSKNDQLFVASPRKAASSYTYTTRYARFNMFWNRNLAEGDLPCVLSASVMPQQALARIKAFRDVLQDRLDHVEARLKELQQWLASFEY